MEKYLEEKKFLSARVSESEAMLTENEKNTADVDEFIRRLKKYASAEEPTREMCIELIERITIGKVVKDKTAEREIHIYYKFMDNGYSEKLHINWFNRPFAIPYTAGVWSIVMGVFFVIAQKNEDKEKARKMIKNYVIGLVKTELSI